MADMTMADLMGDAGLNKQAKTMRSMQAQAQKLRRLGFEPQEVDVLIRGQHGMLRQEDADTFRAAMRKLAIIGRVQGVPGMTKALRGWPGAPDKGGTRIDPSIMEGLESLGFGAGGMIRGNLGDLMDDE